MTNPDFRALCQRMLNDLDALVADSEGVAGLHLNGDLAPWDELMEGGRFEEWTAAFTEARAALAQEQHPSADAILALWEELETDPVAFARAVLERWRAEQQQPRPAPVAAASSFAEWLRNEMPPGTIISDPDWWAARIELAVLSKRPAPVAGEGSLLKYIEELADALESCADLIAEWGAYADKYYQDKHCLAADIAYARSHAKRARAVAQGIDLLGEYDV